MPGTNQPGLAPGVVQHMQPLKKCYGTLGGFDILMSLKSQEKTILPFKVLPNCWFVSNQTGSRMEWALRHTPEHHWAPKTYWNISIYPKIFPHIPNSFTKLHQTQTDINRHWQTTGDSFLHVRLSQSGAKPQFWQNLERQDFFHLTLLRH